MSEPNPPTRGGGLQGQKSDNYDEDEYVEDEEYDQVQPGDYQDSDSDEGSSSDFHVYMENANPYALLFVGAGISCCLCIPIVVLCLACLAIRGKGQPR